MPLTEEQKATIREEEAYRAQVRNDATPQLKKKSSGCIGFLIASIVLLFVVSIISNIMSHSARSSTATPTPTPNTAKPLTDSQILSSYKIISTDTERRGDGAPTYNVLVPQVDLSTVHFERTVELILANLVHKHGETISASFFDSQDGYNADLKYEGLESSMCTTDAHGQTVTDSAIVTACRAPYLAILEQHFIAAYDGQMNGNSADHTLEFFPAATSSSPTVGKYFMTIQFDPGTYK